MLRSREAGNAGKVCGRSLADGFNLAEDQHPMHQAGPVRGAFGSTSPHGIIGRDRKYF